MTFSFLTETLGIARIPEYLPALYERMAADGTLDDTCYLDASYIRAVDAAYSLFDHTLPLLLDAAQAIRGDPLLRCYMNLLREAMRDRAAFRRSGVPLPPLCEGDIARDFIGILAMLPLIEDTARLMRARQFDADMTRYVLRHFESCIDVHVRRFGRPALNQMYFGWLQHYLDIDILPCGGFEFERMSAMPQRVAVLRNRERGESVCLIPSLRMHRDGMVLGSADFADEDGAYTAEFAETETDYVGYPCDARGFCIGARRMYPKAEWEAALRPGDPVLNVHIPKKAKLGGSAFYDAYTEALAMYRRYFPEFQPKAVTCFSWLMDRRIDEICGGAANIVHFQSYFSPFPIRSDGREVFNFVFTKPFASLDDLPEDTRLMRGLKARYLGGKHIHSFGGMLLL